MADVITEALGGFFWFGALNSTRHVFEILDLWTESDNRAEQSLENFSGGQMVRESRDTRTVLALLQDGRFRLDLLTGHSKGNLVLSEALYELKAADEERLSALAKVTHIVTISAQIAMPHPVNVTNVIGAWDWFGELNSRSDIYPARVVPAAWHHTNTELLGHLPVTTTLAAILRN